MHRVVFCFIALLLLTGCENRLIRTRLNSAEAVIQSRPDSALALIRSIDTTKPGTRELRARYALLHAMSLDKNWIDTTDISIVMPAVQYYDRHKPLTARAKPWYYLGRIQYNGRHYDEAIISFIRAKEYAEDLADDRFKALICQAIADTYNCCYLFEEALKFSQDAYRYSLAAEDSMLANAILYNIARQHNNLQQYQVADSIFQKLIRTDIINPNTLPALFADYALLTIVYKKDCQDALRLFEEALSYQKGLPDRQHWLAYAYCLHETGSHEKSIALVRQFEKTKQENDYIYLIWKSRIEEKKKDYQMAYELLDSSSVKQAENLRIILGQSAIKAQRDYFTLQNDSLKKENHLRKWINLLLAITILTAAFTATVLVRRYRENVRRKNQQLMEAAQELIEQRQAISALSAEIDNTARQQAQLRQDFFHINQESFKELSDLCNTYFKTEGRSSQANSVCAEVRGLMKELGIGEQQYPTLERRINEQFDHVMDHFRSEHPGHREQFFQTACYLFAGFKTRTIALLLRLSEQDVYQVRWRLRKEVESTPSPHQNDYLALLGGSEKQMSASVFKEL